VEESRERLYDACRRLELEYWPSAANYVLVRVGEAAPFVEALAARKIHVRDRSRDPVTPGCIRVTAGMTEHTKTAIDALEAVVAALRGAPRTAPLGSGQAL
jgi:histidinol-phosphate aminotransferase